MKKRVLSMCIVLVMVLVCTCSNFVIAASKPRLGVASPSSGTVEVGGSVTYKVNIYGATSVNLKPSDIRITGVSANISVSGSGVNERYITLSNIQGSVGATGYISYIAGGVATNEAGGNIEMSGNIGWNSATFTIVASYVPEPTPSPAPSGDNGNNYLPPSVDNGDNNSGNQEEQKPEEKDETAPTMEIGDFSKSSCERGEEISFEITYKDDKEMGDITLEKKDITLYGFKADVKISGDGNKRKVTLSNISGNLGGLKYVSIAGGTAADKAGNKVKDGGKTAMFKVVDQDTKNKPDDWIENPNTGR